MKITTSQLRHVIRKEVDRLIHETLKVERGFDPMKWANDPARTSEDFLNALNAEEDDQGISYGRGILPDESFDDLKKRFLSMYDTYDPATNVPQKPLSISDMVKDKLGKLGMTEAMSRITPDEVAAWKNGNWSYVSGDEVEDDLHKMDMSMMMGDDPERFLHGKDPHDDEGSMVKSRLYSMKQMAKDVCDILNPADQLPGWVQDHISVAHENLQQVHGYLMGQQHATERGMMESKPKKTLSEAHNRITKEEMDAWMRGDWGFISEDSDKED